MGIGNYFNNSTTTGQTAVGFGWSYVLGTENLISIVHEIGHVLGLEHTFNTKNASSISKNSTINIMDYESNYTNHRKLFYKNQIQYIYEKHKGIKNNK